jgi:hypothetical protein
MKSMLTRVRAAAAAPALTTVLAIVHHLIVVAFDKTDGRSLNLLGKGALSNRMSALLSRYATSQ